MSKNPVAYINVEERKLEWVKPTAWETPTIVANLEPIPLYMKHEWVGLTEEEIFAIGKELGLKCSLGGNPHIDIDYAKAIEAKLKDKNT